MQKIISGTIFCARLSNAAPHLLQKAAVAGSGVPHALQNLAGSLPTGVTGKMDVID